MMKKTKPSGKLNKPRQGHTVVHGWTYYCLYLVGICSTSTICCVDLPIALLHLIP